MSQNTTKTTNIAIVGAGASGLLTSIFLAKKGFRVSLFEANNKVGKKLLATGNGRCNITNQNISIKYFHTSSTQNQELKKIFNKYDYNYIKKIFQELGIEFYKQDDGTKVFPFTLKASTVVDVLKDRALFYGVKIYYDTKITSIMYQNNIFSLNHTYKAHKVVLATGSIASKKLGGSCSGYDLAKIFSHTITPLYPTLVQLVSDTKNLDILQGIKLDAQISGMRGDLLFTKYGISGSLVLDISREVSICLETEKAIKLSFDILPSISKEKLTTLLTKRVKALPDIDIVRWFDGILQPKLTKCILNLVNIPYSTPSKNINRKYISQIVYAIKNFQVNIIDTKGFEWAEVISGGVSLDEVNLKTMESKLQKDLYFTGELLDIDGECGGYNLHWAWVSSSICASSI